MFNCEVESEVGFKIAPVGARLIDSAKKLTKEFFEALGKGGRMTASVAQHHARNKIYRRPAGALDPASFGPSAIRLGHGNAQNVYGENL